MNHEKGHDRWTVFSENFGKEEECPRCHRIKVLGTLEDGCKMCQSCYHKAHGMAELPSDTMVDDMTTVKDKIFQLIKEIWGKDKMKAGFCWVAAKFGNDHAMSSYKKLGQIADCLRSKKDKVECPVHDRVHTAKV